ncbi:MAG: fused MFS/spermidine synthase [Thermodesulfobacteriota bacterium]
MNKTLFLSLLFSLVSVWTAPSPAWPEMDKILYERDSLYHHLQVSEADGYRYLSFNRARGNQSVVSIADPYELKFPYTQAVFVVPAFLDQKPGRILILGLGGGTIPRVLAKYYPDIPIDIVEIDSDVVDVAWRYFFFETTKKMKVTTMDGRRFLRSSRNRYDIIFLDAYDDQSIPFHLTTKEFFEIVKQRLTPTGVVAANVWGPRTDEFYLSELKTYQQVFPHVYVIDCITSFSYIFIAHAHDKVMTKATLQDRIPAFQNWFKFNFQLMPYANTFENMSAVPVNAKVLLDDFAPVEVLRSRKALF